jgi:purine-binding chemotaxis protein CheW
MSIVNKLANKESLELSTSAVDYVTFVVQGQLFAVPATHIKEILRHQPLAPVPQADESIAGLMNLRGHIVTAIDPARKLGFEPSVTKTMCMVIEHTNELFALMVDKIGDVLRIGPSQIEANPASLSQSWQALSNGVHKIEGQLIVMLNVDTLFSFQA